jgi:hypothetical protein
MKIEKRTKNSPGLSIGLSIRRSLMTSINLLNAQDWTSRHGNPVKYRSENIDERSKIAIGKNPLPLELRLPVKIADYTAGQ